MREQRSASGKASAIATVGMCQPQVEIEMSLEAPADATSALRKINAGRA